MDTYKLKTMYKLKHARLQNEIFRFLCIKAGISLNHRRIARPLKVSPTAVAKALKGLVAEGLVKAEKSQTMNLVSVELNRDNPKAIEMKRVENLKMIYESGLAEYLSEKLPGCVIIFFGSYSLGEDTKNSDIDIAVIGSKEKNIDIMRFSSLLERVVFLHFYEDLKGINKNLRSNILRGITLAGVAEI